MIATRAGARIIHNPEFASGMYSSIRIGVRHITKQSDGFFLLPVDIPLVRTGTIRLLTRSFSAGNSNKIKIVYPTFTGKRGHPPLISGTLISTILKKKQAKGGLRSLLAQVEKKQPKKVTEVEVPDGNILFDMDTPEEYTTGLSRFCRLNYPTREECATILQLHPMPERGWAHGRLVARIAVALGQAIVQKNQRHLDLELCRVAGLLHDIAKGHPNHEQTGAYWLQDLGFTMAAEIVAAHKDMTWQPGAPITEKELVHLADKMARGNRIVDMQERFGEKIALYANNKEAVQAISNRYEQARLLTTAFEAEAGRRVVDIIANSLLPCNL